MAVDIVDQVADAIMRLTNCFWCIGELRDRQEYANAQLTMTMYKGTPCCGYHAYELWKKEREEAEEA